MDAWEASSGNWLWTSKIFFFLGTLFINIVILNMLIAILNDTFIKVYSRLPVNANKTKLRLVSEIEKNFFDAAFKDN